MSACIWMAARPWPTTSWTSWDRRSRSASAMRRSASARSRACASTTMRRAAPTVNGTITQAAPGASPARPIEPVNVWTSRIASAAAAQSAARRSARWRPAE
ncbi:hypothetical protein GCM10010167_02830 [Paractinoplanes deccanensis]